MLKVLSLALVEELVEEVVEGTRTEGGDVACWLGEW